MKRSHSGPVFFLIMMLALTLLLGACATPAPATSAPAATTKAPTSVTPATTAAAPAKPQGELAVAASGFGNENFLPWKADTFSSQLCVLVYDLLIYYDEIDLKYIPGLAESWETSPDAMTLTYHLRKGVQFQDGWGELTSADVKFNFEQQAAPGSNGLAASRQIASMDIPDPSTLVLHFKTPQPIFFATFSMGNGATCQGIVSKKYVETVGDTAAAQKPVGTGPYKLVEGRLASYYKFEALESHWRVVPEFKNLTVRLVPEISTTVAMLKTKEIDLANVPAEQLADLKAAGLATEVSPAGGAILDLTWGGCVIPEDSRYDAAYHNKDPWTDVRVRKAMALAIDRQAICNTIFAGGATPVSVPLFSAGMDKYQYSYDPAAARQLLKDAGYPNGFTFEAISYELRGIPETARLIEALVGYWQQIGLDPKITVIDYAAFGATHRGTLKTAGEISINRNSKTADSLDKATLYFKPDAMVVYFQDEESYAILKEGSAKVNSDERDAYVEKLNKYFYENYCGAVVRIAFNYAWNSAKVAPFAHSGGSTPDYFEYVRHAQPLNTFRLFTPWPGR